jgi:hypothetical protein
MLTNEADHKDDSIDLREIGISEDQAAELLVRFATFEDWNDPEMDIYNDYPAAKNAVESNRRQGSAQ